jgi:hypothetical protein
MAQGQAGAVAIAERLSGDADSVRASLLVVGTSPIPGRPGE